MKKIIIILTSLILINPILADEHADNPLYATCKKDLETEKTENERLRKGIEAIQPILQKLQAENEANSDAIAAEKAAQAELMKLKANVITLENELQELHAGTIVPETLEKDFESKTKEINRLIEQIGTHEATIKTAEKESFKQDASIASITNQLNTITVQLKASEAQTELLKQELEKKDTEFIAHEKSNQVAVEEKYKQQFENQISDLTGENTSLTKQLSQIKDELETANANNATAARLGQELQIQLESLKSSKQENIDQLRRSIATFEKEAEKDANKIAALQVVKTDHEQLKTTHQQQAAQLATLTQELAQEKAKVAPLESNNEQLKKKNHEYTEKNERLDVKIKQLEEELKTAKAPNANEEILEAQVEELKEELEKAKGKPADTAQEKAFLEAQKQKIATLQTSIQNLEAAVAA